MPLSMLWPYKMALGIMKLSIKMLLSLYFNYEYILNNDSVLKNDYMTLSKMTINLAV